MYYQSINEHLMPQRQEDEEEEEEKGNSTEQEPTEIRSNRLL